jgi:oxygen-independent coproporphyrinogen III oxidase
MIDHDRIAAALGSSPTAAYTAPHDYPHAVPDFQPAPCRERERVQSDQLRLYVHVPFCNYACTFCCYARKVGIDVVQMQRYVKALKRELEWVEPGTPVSQFFIGGGTPTALPAPLLDEVLEAIVTRMPFYGDFVHTVEGSPDSVSDAHIEVLRQRGVQRLSMGIQSLREGVLDAVRRDHDRDTAIDACRRVMDGGLILNIDLMYGLPGQTESDLWDDFRTAAEQGVHAITAYNLRLNEYTAVARQMVAEKRFDLAGLIRWRQFLQDTAAEFGYTQTRWHTFKRMDSIAARHKRIPVSGSDLRGYQLGIGMSARSSLGHTVYRNHRNLSTYMERVEAGASPVEEVFPLREEDLHTQFIARTIGDGGQLLLAEYEQAFGHPFDADYRDVLAALRSGGLIEEDGERIGLSATGRLVYDLVTLAFYPPRAKEWLLERLREYQLIGTAAPAAAAKPVRLHRA